MVCTGSLQVEVGGGVASVTCAKGANTLSADCKRLSPSASCWDRVKKLELKKLKLAAQYK